MSQRVGVVLVLPQHAESSSEAVQHLRAMLSKKMAGSISIADVYQSPLGYDVLRITTDVNRLLRDDADELLDVFEAILWAGLNDAHAEYGYFTTYADQLVEAWIEPNILSSLLADEHKRLSSSLYHLEVRPAKRQTQPIVGQILRESEIGQLIRFGRQKNPYTE